MTNFGGGNTSAKIRATDPLTGQPTDVLWVKGSGGDLGSMKLDGFATLYLDKLLALETRYRGRAHEDEMVAYLPYCTFGLNPRAASIDTPLHAFLPFAHVDHVIPMRSSLWRPPKWGSRHRGSLSWRSGLAFDGSGRASIWVSAPGKP